MPGVSNVWWITWSDCASPSSLRLFPSSELCLRNSRASCEDIPFSLLPWNYLSALFGLLGHPAEIHSFLKIPISSAYKAGCAWQLKLSCWAQRSSAEGSVFISTVFPLVKPGRVQLLGIGQYGQLVCTRHLLEATYSQHIFFSSLTTISGGMWLTVTVCTEGRLTLVEIKFTW